MQITSPRKGLFTLISTLPSSEVTTRAYGPQTRRGANGQDWSRYIWIYIYIYMNGTAEGNTILEVQAFKKQHIMINPSYRKVSFLSLIPQDKLYITPSSSNSWGNRINAKALQWIPLNTKNYTDQHFSTNFFFPHCQLNTEFYFHSLTMKGHTLKPTHIPSISV